MDPTTKLVPSFEVGKRNIATAHSFMYDLRRRLVGRPTIITDGFAPYIEAVQRTARPRGATPLTYALFTHRLTSGRDASLDVVAMSEDALLHDRVVKATMETIGRYFNERLKSVFAAVADQPKVLRNKARCPLYLLCFAVGNRNGAPIALRIANHLLTKGVL